MSIKKLKEISLKRSAGLTAAVLSILLLTSCGTAIESSGAYSESEETAGTKQVSESEDAMVRAAPDIDSQLMFISDKYDDLYSDFLTDDSILPATVCAVTDLNHNGRLEVLITACLGTGAYSYTKVYEISEDYTDLVNLEFKNISMIEDDGSGDFYNLACIFRGGGAACPAWREPRVRTRRSHPFGTNVIQRLLSHRPLASTCRVLHQWP